MATAPKPSETSDSDGVEIVEVTPEEGMRLLDRQTRARLNMSAEEFIQRWEAGNIEDPDRTDVLMCAFMIGLTR
jgi:hypothetical protein